MWQIINEYLGISIMLIGTYLFGKIILNTKVKITTKKFILLLILISLIQTITKINVVGIFKTIIIVFTNILFYKYIYKITIKKSILLSFLQMLILMLPDLVQIFFVTNILNISKTVYYELFAGSILGNLTTLILFLIIVWLFRKIIRMIIEEKIDIKIVFFTIITVTCVLSLFYGVVKEFQFDNNVTLYILCIIISTTVLFSLIKQTIENNKLTEKYDKLLEFMITYENEIENQRILRHEIKNEFRTIRAKICDNQENKEIIDYIDEIVSDKYEMNKEKYAKFGYLPPNGIKGLFYFKTQEAENKGLKVGINISKKIKDSSIYKLNIKEQRDFGRIIGVYLDNAIEASMESEEKQIGIEIYVQNEETQIIISNTYKNEINKEKLGKERISTKGNKRGHGLLLVKQILNKNNSFKCKTEIQEKIYVQMIKIKNIEK